jgi:hypothetical protein
MFFVRSAKNPGVVDGKEPLAMICIPVNASAGGLLPHQVLKALGGC